MEWCESLPKPVLTKRDMYQRLAAGEFGNTLQQWFDLEEWLASPEYTKHPLWGIRSGLLCGDKRMRLNVPTAEVAPLYKEWFPHGGGNLTAMIDQYALLRAEVMENDFGDPVGLYLFGVLPGHPIDPQDPWRGSFKKWGIQQYGLTALHTLKKYLWPSDLEDLFAVLARFPGHVVELSACDRAVGKIPHRNTICWECRRY